MMKRSAHPRKILSCLEIVLPCLLLISILLACGNMQDTGASADSTTTPATLTGSAAISLRWHSLDELSGSGATADNAKAAITDCVTEGVTQIQCSVYDASDTPLLEGDRWECSEHRGTLDGIPVGANRKFVCVGLNGEEIVHMGQIEDVTITANKTAQMKTPIDFYPFTVQLVSPAEGASIAAAGVPLTWSTVPNAYQYLVEIATDLNFANVVESEPTSQTNFLPQRLAPSNTYFWRVTPWDYQGDPGRSSEVRSFTTTVVTACVAPTLNSIGNHAVNAGERMTFTLTATDPNPGETLTFTANPLPGTATLDPATGVFAWDTTSADSGYHQVIFSVCDTCPQGPRCDTEEVTLSVSGACNAPVLDPIGPRQVNVGATLSFTFNATDIDPGTVLTYRVENMPSDATVDNATRTFSWTPTANSVGNHDVRFSVCDNCPTRPLCDDETVRITVTAPTSTGDFVGSWVNNDPQTIDITRLEITSDGILQRRYSVHAYAVCATGECDWSTVGATVNGDNTLTAVFNQPTAAHQLTISLQNQNQLRVSHFIDYPDLTPDQTIELQLRRSQASLE